MSRPFVSPPTALRTGFDSLHSHRTNGTGALGTNGTGALRSNGSGAFRMDGG